MSRDVVYTRGVFMRTNDGDADGLDVPGKVGPRQVVGAGADGDLGRFRERPDEQLHLPVSVDDEGAFVHQRRDDVRREGGHRKALAVCVVAVEDEEVVAKRRAGASVESRKKVVYFFFAGDAAGFFYLRAATGPVVRRPIGGRPVRGAGRVRRGRKRRWGVDGRTRERTRPDGIDGGRRGGRFGGR